MKDRMYFGADLFCSAVAGSTGGNGKLVRSRITHTVLTTRVMSRFQPERSEEFYASEA